MVIHSGGHVSEMVRVVGIPLAVAIIGLAGTIFVAALSFALGWWAEASARRRDSLHPAIF